MMRARHVALFLIAFVLAACSLRDATQPPPSTGTVLPGTRWVLTSLRGQPLLPGTRITLEFGKQSFSGFTGCNTYGGGPDCRSVRREKSMIAVEVLTWSIEKRGQPSALPLP